MNKDLSKAIMKRTKLRNIYLKTELKKIEIIILSRETYVLHFCEKVKENFMEVSM